MKTLNYALALLLLCSCSTKPITICESQVPVKIIQQEPGEYIVTTNNTEEVKFTTTEKQDSDGLIDDLSNFMDSTSGLVGWIALIIVAL